MPDEQKSFWTSLPGILTGVAAVITAVTGLYLAMGRGNGRASNGDDGSMPPPKDTLATVVSPAEAFRGIWANVDSNTGGITKLVILRKEQDVFVHAWGKCHPTDCDWGEEKGSLEGSILKAMWRWAGGQRDMSVTLDGQRLKAELINVYDDGRPPRQSDDLFRKES